MLAQYTEHCVM